jgi:amidase
MGDSTWIVRLDAPGDGPRLAVKDCIDVEGLPIPYAAV